METQEADQIHGLVLRSGIGRPFVRTALIAFNLHQFRDAPDRDRIDCGHTIARRWKSFGQDGAFCNDCQRVYPVRPANPPQVRPTPEQLDGAVAELRLLKRMAEAPRRSR